MRKSLIIVGAVVVAVIAWHVIASSRLKVGDVVYVGDDVPFEVSLGVNPLNDIAAVQIVKTVAAEDTWGRLEALLGETAIERELSLRAREQFDIYAMIVPYRVRTTYRDATNAWTANARAAAECDFWDAYGEDTEDMVPAGRFAEGEELRITERMIDGSGAWARVKTEDGKRGWVPWKLVIEF